MGITNFMPYVRMTAVQKHKELEQALVAIRNWTDFNPISCKWLQNGQYGIEEVCFQVAEYVLFCYLSARAHHRPLVCACVNVHFQVTQLQAKILDHIDWIWTNGIKEEEKLQPKK